MQNLLLFWLLSLLTISCIAQEDRIVFSSDRNGNFDIYSMRPDGSDIKQLTRNEARDSWPKWSPNGQQIVFTSNRRGKGQIHIMDADGDNLRNISNNRFNELDPVISPDGQQVAFISKASGTYQIYLMNIDGTDRRQLTNIGPFCGRPDWSPDGRRLVYLSMENGYYEIYRINIDGSGKRQLTDFKTETGAPTWSKHGYYILFNAHENEVDYLFQMKPDGSGLKKIKEGHASDFRARWNGSSDKLVYNSLRDGNYELYTYDLRTKEEKRITDNQAKDGTADWFSPADTPQLPAQLSPAIPDNHRIAYVSYRGGSGDVFISKPDGTAVQRITDTDDNNSFPKGAGDGQHLIYRRSDPQNPRESANYKINLQTGKESLYAPLPIVEGAFEEIPNPSGKYLAYAKTVDGVNEIFLFDEHSKQHQQITNNKIEETPAQIGRSFWSHDGKKLAILRGVDYYNLYLNIYYPETGEMKAISPRGYMFSGVVWTKDDLELIINIKIRDKTTYELWSINADGTDLRQLTDHPGRGSVHPSLSPDGNWIAFETGRDGDDGEIYLMRPDGRDQTRISFHRSYEGRPAWIVLE